MLTIRPKGAAAALLRSEGFPSERNGAEKISKPRFNARGFLKNFWPVSDQKTAESPPAGSTTNPAMRDG